MAIQKRHNNVYSRESGTSDLHYLKCITYLLTHGNGIRSVEVETLATGMQMSLHANEDRTTLT